MGQKVHPNGMRLGIVKDHKARWYESNKKNYAKTLLSDIEIRDWLKKKLAHASVSEVKIARTNNNAKVTLHSARPGLIIGKKGQDVEDLRKGLEAKTEIPVQITIEEIRKPELDSQLVAESIAQQLEKRIMYRRAMKRAIQNTMRAGAEGIKVMLSGRLAGAEIARTEWYHEGRVPLHTLRADIDYALAEAETTYGVIGIKVWIFRGEVIEEKGAAEKASSTETNNEAAAPAA